MASLEETVSEAFGEEIEVTEPISPDPLEAPEASVEEEGTSPERPRDEQGRFAAKEQEDPDVNRYLDRFGGDVDKALRAAVEADSMIGRQGQQMGELQKQLTEIQQAVTPQESQGVQIDQNTVDWFDEQIEENTYGAVVWAMQNDPSGSLYNRAMDSWYEENPRHASAFERQLEMQQFAQAFQQQQAPLHQMAEQNQFAAAWAGLKQEIPDLDNQAEAILKAAEDAPEMLSILQSGSPDAKQRVIRNLYKLSKFEQANQLAGAPQGQEAAATDLQNAFVASGSQHVDPNVKSAGEKWAEENLDPELERYFGVRPF